MNLCIDIGNTQLKIAIFAPDALHPQQLWTMPEAHLPTLADIIQQFSIQHCIVASVRQHDEILHQFLQNQVTTVLSYNNTTPIPIQSNYQTPQTLGADRLANAVAAHALFPQQNCLIIDAGTCIKYDFIQQNTYLGGSIAAGLQMRYKALHHFTAKLPLIERQHLTDLVGFSTETAISTGVQWGLMFEIEGFIRAYRQQFGEMQVILTGGDAPFLETQLKNCIFAQPKLTETPNHLEGISSLVLIGLNQILTFNVF